MSASPQGYEPLEYERLDQPSHERYQEERETKTLEAYDAQQPFLNHGETYHAIITGIGAGKTTGLIMRVGLNAQYWNPGRTGVVVAPTVPSLRNVIIPELRKWGFLDIGEWKPSEKTWTLPNGSTVIFESADNERKIQRLRGPNIGWFGMDEPSTISKTAWDIMVGRLRDGDYINAFVSGTPKGYNWVYDKFVDEETRLNDVNLVDDIASRENPHLPDIYTDEIIEQYEGQFYKQEVLGQFVQFEGLVYPWFDRDEHLLESDEGHPVDVAELDEVIYGQDWGFQNPSATVAWGRRGDQWVVLEEFYERRCTTDDVAQRVHQMQETWLPGPVYCDPSEPSAIEEFQRDGLDAKKADNSVTPGISKLTELGEQENIRVHESCQNWLNEIQQYQWKDDESDDPEKVNDHLMDASRYALYTHTSPDDTNSGTGVW